MTLSWEWYLGGILFLMFLGSLRRKTPELLDGSSDATVTRTSISFGGEANVADAGLPDVVQQLIKSGDKIAAIKTLREATGMDLTDAHTAVSNWESNDGSVRLQSSVQVIAAGNLPPDIVELVKNGKAIEAIRRLRQEAGMRTADAKRAVDAAVSESAATADFNSPRANPISRER